ncbi:hypothetical protein BY458DRAFT_517845 [Sporodiniella umbellata]|nr:hypothetical protein BY458DRAFT_517845 [Sporodiniella umbellata]
MFDSFALVNKKSNSSVNDQEHNPFEQSFASTPPSTYEFIQVNNHKWGSDSGSCKSNIDTVSSLESEDRLVKKTSKETTARPKRQRKRAPKIFQNEEDRRDFLERNRLAALKCRQRKKQWLSNLQDRMDFLTQDNEQLEVETNQMKQEIAQLKQLLMSHKDCPKFNSASLSEKQYFQSESYYTVI